MKRVLLLKTKLKRIEEKANAYKKEYGLSFVLLFDLGGAAAGQVTMYKDANRPRTLRLNKAYIDNNYEDIIGQTLPHEVAHLLAWDKYGRASKGHGGAWKEMMAKLGVPAERTHKMDASAVYKNTLYCDCTAHPVSTRMYNSVARGKGRRCRKCKLYMFS